jgi:hypothetical protein
VEPFPCSKEEGNCLRESAHAKCTRNFLSDVCCILGKRQKHVITANADILRLGPYKNCGGRHFPAKNAHSR